MIAWVPYCGEAPSPDEILLRWNLDPALVAAAIAATAAPSILGKKYNRAFAFAAIAALLVSFVSPLCALSSALFSARAVHHILLMAVAAPLLAWAISRAHLKPPPLGLATLVQALTLWLWHAPSLYAAALSNDSLYWVMQFSLGASALAFWISLRATALPAAMAALLFTTMQMGLLGALLAFAPTPLYAPHAATTLAWGLSPLADQRLAGLIMWAPASALYLLVSLFLLYRSLAPKPRAA